MNTKARQQAKARRRRNRIIIAIGTAVVLVAALVIALVSGGGSSSSNTTLAPDATAAVVAKATSVPAATLDAVGVGAATGLPEVVSGTPLTKDGKPEILYIGAEYCPFCATERWPMVIALSRFGTFSNLGLTHSSSVDVYPSTPTFTFHGATYSSQYVAFTAVETATNQPNGSGGYQPLDSPTADQLAAFRELNPGGGIPFLDFAGRYLVGGASYDAGVLQGHTADQVATALSDPTSAIAKGALGAANVLTAAICQLTNQQPATVCGSATITGIVAQLGG